MKRILTGSRSSGSPHLGNYLGAYKPLLSYQEQYQTFFFLADYHALNEGPEPEKMRKDSLDMIATMLGIGLDPQKTVLYAQSSVPEVAELCWLLSCFTSYGAMQRSVAFKDAQAKGIEVNMGVFNYPILMAADILLYDADFVPVGADQKQHLEVSRDLAVRMNARYGDLFKVPEPLISDVLGLVPGTDGRKMSKSYNNGISVFATDKVWKTQVMGITTDSKGLADVKDPDTCTIFQIYSMLASEDEIAAMRAKYVAGNYGYGHAKLELLEKIKSIFGPMRDRYFAALEKQDDLKDVLVEGSKQASALAREKLAHVKDVMGLLGSRF